MQDIKRVPSQIITTASADVPLKGLDFTLHAVARLKADYPKLKLVIIGAPRPGGHTERLIKELKIDQNILYQNHNVAHVLQTIIILI